MLGPHPRPSREIPEEPMIRHTVLLTFGDTDESTIDAVVDELRTLPGLIPEIAAYTVGRDLAMQPGTADVVVIGDFATVEDYRAYANHPEHLRVIEEHLRPHMTGSVRAQFEPD
jgi:hypothetical protein